MSVLLTSPSSASLPSFLHALNEVGSDFRWASAPLSNFAWPLGAVGAYLAVIYGIQWHVKVNRKGVGYDVQRLFAYHNLLMSFLSLLMFLGTAVSFFARVNEEGSVVAFCESFTSPFTFDAKTREDGTRGSFFFWAYVYYLSKYYELLDTVFLALKGKLEGWGGLNVYHHSLVVIMGWLWLEYGQSLQHIGVLFNTGVHVVMYYYFFLSGLGLRPRWKKVVTLIQITQFVCSFLAVVPNLYLHFVAQPWGSKGCHGQLALLFNLVFNATLLLEFVAIFGGGKGASKGAKAEAKTLGQVRRQELETNKQPGDTAAAAGKKGSVAPVQDEDVAAGLTQRKAANNKADVLH